jgi:hypothetical protein
MAGEGTKDSVFSPLVDLTSNALGEQVDRTTSGSQEVLKRIAEIDSEEKDLYKTLLKTSDDIREIKETQQQDPSKLNSNTKQTLAQELKNLTNLQKSIKAQIESLGKMRIQLYKDLGEKYVDLQTVVGQSRNDLVDQRTVADMMGSQLQSLESEYDSLQQEKNRKARLTEIDTYYSKRYRSYADLMKLIAYICIPLLVVAVIYRMEYIGDGIRSTLVMIVLVIGGYLVFRKSMDIWYRDNMNWDEYRWGFDGEDQGESVWEYDKKQLDKMWGESGGMMNEVSKTLGFACVNEHCCKHPKVMWDKKAKMCVMKGGSKGKGHGGHGGHDKSMEDAKSAAVTTKVHKDAFTPLHAAPICPTGKALGAQVNESCGIACDLGNLAQNYCGGASDGSPIDGFDGF